MHPSVQGRAHWAGGCWAAQHCCQPQHELGGWINVRVPLGGSSLKAGAPALCTDFCLLPDTDFLLLPPGAPLKKYQCSLIMGLNAVAADKSDKITHAHCHGNLLQLLFGLDVSALWCECRCVGLVEIWPGNHLNLEDLFSVMSSDMDVEPLNSSLSYCPPSA